MSLELVNTFGTLLTVAIIAATAIAAMVQLRHLRAGNQINAMLTIGESYFGREFMDAVFVISNKLASALADPHFRDFEVAMRRGTPVPELSSESLEVRRAALLVCNTHEEIGTLVKRGVIDRAIFLETRYSMILSQWARLGDFIAFRRDVEQDDSAWENFELLAVWSQDWARRRVSSYPRGVRRWRLHNPWPVPPTAATASSTTGH